MTYHLGAFVAKGPNGPVQINISQDAIEYCQNGYISIVPRSLKRLETNQGYTVIRVLPYTYEINHPDYAKPIRVTADVDIGFPGSSEPMRRYPA